MMPNKSAQGGWSPFGPPTSPNPFASSPFVPPPPRPMEATVTTKGTGGKGKWKGDGWGKQYEHQPSKTRPQAQSWYDEQYYDATQAQGAKGPKGGKPKGKTWGKAGIGKHSKLSHRA